MDTESRGAANGLLFQLRDELDRWLGMVRGGNGTWPPATDVYEVDGELYIEMEMPGVEACDIEIVTEEQDVTVRALSSDPRPPKNAELMERRRGTFERTLNISLGWDGSRSKADFRNGVLTLRCPRAIEPEKAHRISLGSAAPTASRSFSTTPVSTEPRPNGPAPKTMEVPSVAPSMIVGAQVEEKKP